MSLWPGVGRTPLILPGNPALSEDEVRRRISPVRIVGGTAVGIAALFGALYLTSASEPEEPALLYATGTTGLPAELIDSTPPASVPLPSAAATTPSPQPASTAAATTAPVQIDVPAEPALEPIPAFVPSASTPLPAAEPPAPVRKPTSVPSRPVAPSVASATPGRAPASLAVPPAPRSVASAPRPVTPPASARTALVATAPAAPRALVALPVLKLTPLVSDSLRPGELLQLRWSVQDPSTGRAAKADMEFTSTDASVASVDRRTGMVSARRPGRVRIIVDAGSGRDTTVSLIVRPPATVAVVLPASTETPQARSEAARSTSVIATPPAPVVAAPPAAPSPPTPTTARDARRDEMPNDADIRIAVDRVVNDVRRSGGRNAQIMEFFADGDGHRVAVIGTPASSNAGNNTVRVSFDLRLTKFDGGGRPVARVAPVSLTVDKRESAVTSSAITIGALRRQ